ncbi:hypothetical protein EVAR_82510_1 [Eumeta japonica]|uniref:Uncharacterized protein n=1 Tax=Eumeta variegata TaxID=151549 RepID=A0A4C1UWF8_EUMVA|nr:hypothetical protein EVAR_82510_1 [Eumeta japonica]
MSFSSTLLHARKSRANSEISELLTARRMDITVWMSSPNDEVPAVAEAGGDTGGSRRTASPDGPGATLGGRVDFGLPHRLEAGREVAAGGLGLSDTPYSWPYAAGDNSRRKVSFQTHEYAGTLWYNVGPNISRSAAALQLAAALYGQLAAVAPPWTSFLVRGLYSDTRETTHHVQIVENILGFLGPGKDGENLP